MESDTDPRNFITAVVKFQNSMIKYPLPFPLSGFTFGEPITNIWDYTRMFYRIQGTKEIMLEQPTFQWYYKIYTERVGYLDIFEWCLVHSVMN